MANIRKRGNTYQIRVSCGYDIRGVQQFQSMTWNPEEGMTPKQIEKELNRQAIMFEEECKKRTDYFTCEIRNSCRRMVRAVC